MESVKAPDRPQNDKLSEWVTCCQTPLLRTCYLYLHDASLAQDAVQETFIRAYRTFSSFRGNCSEKTWLTQIAINICRDMLRSAWFRHIDRSVTPEDLPESVPESTDESESNSVLTAAVMNLPRKLRETVILYYYQCMSASDIAAALGISKSTVCTRLKRARDKLRSELIEGRDLFEQE